MGGAADGLLAQVVEQLDAALGGDRVVGDVHAGLVGRNSQVVAAGSHHPHPLDPEGAEPGRELFAGLVGGVGLDERDTAAAGGGPDPGDVAGRGVGFGP